MLSNLTMRHHIETIAIPAMNKQQKRSAHLRSVYRSVLRFCLKERLPCLILDPINFRRRLTGTLRPTRSNATRRLVEFYPELGRYARTSDWERKYYGHVFTAIACGLAAVDFEPGDQKERTPYE